MTPWWKLHQQRALRPRQHICFASSSRFAVTVSRTFNTRGKSAGFRRAMISPCGTIPIRPITDRLSLAPSLLYPPPRSASCSRLRLPAAAEAGRTNGFTTFSQVCTHERGLGRASSAGGAVVLRREEGSDPPQPDHIPFGSSLSASLACRTYHGDLRQHFTWVDHATPS